MKNPFLQALAIAVCGGVVGLVVNSVRANNSIKLSRNYFQIYEGPVVAADDAGHDATVGDPSTADSAAGSTGVAADAKPAESTLEHNFISVSLDDVVELFFDPGFEGGSIVFVDARNHDRFDEGHIPGSLNLDRYNSDQYYDKIELDIENADIVVVYCGGGDCEDSIFLASELVLERGVAHSKIRLFEGGMKAWEADGLEVQQGHD
jgi:rhodanese-related sulfurtransferase